MKTQIGLWIRGTAMGTQVRVWGHGYSYEDTGTAVGTQPHRYCCGNTAMAVGTEVRLCGHRYGCGDTGTTMRTQVRQYGKNNQTWTQPMTIPMNLYFIQ